MESQTPRHISRFITTHDSDGKSIFMNELDLKPPVTELSGGMQSHFCYGTGQFPPTFSNNADVTAYAAMIKVPPGIIISNGTVARLIDLPPGCCSSMHRTISLNYNFVIQGELEVILDSGETRVMKQGDMLVQRGINHQWRNTSQTEWARITAFAVPAESFDVAGETMNSSGPY